MTRDRNIMHRFFSFLFATGMQLCLMRVFAQVFFNSGDTITNLGTAIYVNGGLTNSTNGLFFNTGSIYVTGNWTNNSGNTAFTAASNGTTILDGANQVIQGSSVTEFYNLDLQNNSVKQLNNTNVIVKNTLGLNDCELATGVHTAFVASVSPAAISFTTGFVSSLDSGALQRRTNSVSPYIFPVGSSSGTSRFRPVEITPVNASANTFAVRLANTDATTEGFNISQTLSPPIKSVNPFYYHRIRRDSGTTAATVSIYYDATLDGNYLGMAHWQNVPQWEDVNAAASVGNYGLSNISRQNWSDFSPDAFALFFLKTDCGDVFVPDAFSPNGDHVNDEECVYGKCIKEIFFTIYDRWGEKVFETTDPKQCWDGMYKGKKLNSTVFAYFMKATLTSGEEIVKKGNIILAK